MKVPERESPCLLAAHMAWLFRQGRNLLWGEGANLGFALVFRHH